MTTTVGVVRPDDGRLVGAEEAVGANMTVWALNRSANGGRQEARMNATELWTTTAENDDHVAQCKKGLEFG